jgi:hypothetical protein
MRRVIRRAIRRDKSEIRWFMRQAELRRLCADNGGLPPEIDIDDPMQWSDQQVAEFCNVTLEQRDRLAFRTIKANVPPEVARAHYRNKKRQRDRIRARRRRMNTPRPRKARKADNRCAKVLAHLRKTSEADDRHWSTVEEIAAAVRRSVAFRGLKPASLRPTIHDALDALEGTNEVEQDGAIGKRGLAVRVVRWRKGSAP